MARGNVDVRRSVVRLVAVAAGLTVVFALILGLVAGWDVVLLRTSPVEATVTSAQEGRSCRGGQPGSRYTVEAQWSFDGVQHTETFRSGCSATGYAAGDAVTVYVDSRGSFASTTPPWIAHAGWALGLLLCLVAPWCWLLSRRRRRAATPR